MEGLPVTWSGAKVAVTGAAGGIGTALCEQLIAAGAEVYALDSDPDRLATLEGADRRALDVTERQAVAGEFEAIGPLDALINNAGITSLGPLSETPVEALDRVIDVNMKGAIYCTKAALPGLIERSGRIGVLSSVAGFAPLVHRSAYSAAKHGLHGFFESLRSELSEVSITIVCPTFTRTGIETRAAHRAEGLAGEWTTTGRMMEPQELARRILHGMASRKRLVLPTPTARASYLMWRASPKLYETLMHRRIRSEG